MTLNPDKYPYKPDVVMGYKGSKVALFVLPEDKISSDTNNPDGISKYRMRLL
jgi:hypothetical protein